MTSLISYYSPVDRVFDRAFASLLPSVNRDAGSNGRALKLDVVETPEAYVVKAEVPGVAKDKIEVKVEDRDDTGGFLKTRLQMVQRLCASTPHAYWTNQYGNPDAVDAHYHLTAGDICADFDSLDYVFIGVSTGGTIAGMSRRLKECYPKVRIIAVDTEGSVIFGDAPRKRHIPGVGSSIVPPLLAEALIDDVVLIPERETVAACRELLVTHGLFAGGSSGTAFAAIKRYTPKLTRTRNPKVLFLCADRGMPYLDTVFDPAWANEL